MYSLASYGEMIRDQVRMTAYTDALRAAVQPGSVVLDIGAGSGIFSLLACQFGACRVYAIEPAESIEVGRQIARLNGYGERIVFIQNLSTRITLPEQANVIISDLRGVMPLLQHHIGSIADARARLLAPDGKLIPQRDTLWATLVENRERYLDFTDAWDTERYGLDMEPARRITVNTWMKARTKPEQFLVEPQCWGTLDYTTITSPNVAGELTWTAQRDGTAHGLCLWFEAQIDETSGFSNAPGAPEAIYGNAFFPLASPVEVQAGDTVTVELRANLVGDDYVWMWKTRIRQGAAGPLKANFNQSTFNGTPLSLASLHKQAAGFSPSLSEDGQVTQFVLALMDGTRPLANIADQVVSRFPTRFSSSQDALTHIADLSVKYSR